MNRGVLAGIGAFVLWGILPIYWKEFSGISAMEILCHRIIWSFLLLQLILKYRGQDSWIKKLKSRPRTMLIYLGTAMLIGSNWYIYIWAVHSGYIVETSLGYFINPLVNVLLGVIFLHESLRRAQWVAVGIATFGVIWITLNYGEFPWIALVLAFSFGLYGLFRKTGPLHSMDGLTGETSFLLIPVISYLVYLEINGQSGFIHSGLKNSVLLIGSGLVTAVPLLLFAKAVRSIPLSTVGIIQYLAPSLQLMVGVLIYHETFDRTRLIGFSIIWVALLIYTMDSLQAHRQKLKLVRRTTT